MSIAGMNQCQNCGNLNTPDVNFCRFCGTKFLIAQPMYESRAASVPPRPYAWKTDEFQTKASARSTHPIPPGFPGQPNGLASVSAFSGPAAYGSSYGTNYRCPRCGSSSLPVIERRVSTAGWIVFAALLIFTVIFFWIGLCMKEDVACCPTCKLRVS